MTGPVALVTGVSRRIGIGAAIARRLRADGFQLMLTGHAGYDQAQPYGGDPEGVPALLAELGPPAEDVGYVAADLIGPDAPGRLVDATMERFGAIDVLVANHAYSTHAPLGELVAAEIDRHLLVNVRATMLLVQGFAAARAPGRPDGRVVLMSSGQRLGPMISEPAYAASKAAVEYLVRDFAVGLAGAGVTVNGVNPGPTDTGYASGEAYEQVRRQFPAGRWGTPDDAARLIGWLCSPDAGWVTGQVIDSEGGFNRFG